MSRPPRYPVRAVPLGADVELRVMALEEKGHAGELMLDVRLFRRSPADTSAVAFCPTAAGFRVPVHLSGLVADALRQVATRAAEQLAVSPVQTSARMPKAGP